MCVCVCERECVCVWVGVRVRVRVRVRAGLVHRGAILGEWLPAALLLAAMVLVRMVSGIIQKEGVHW